MQRALVAAHARREHVLLDRRGQNGGRSILEGQVAVSVVLPGAAAQLPIWLCDQRGQAGLPDFVLGSIRSDGGLEFQIGVGEHVEGGESSGKRIPR